MWLYFSELCDIKSQLCYKVAITFFIFRSVLETSFHSYQLSNIKSYEKELYFGQNVHICAFLVYESKTFVRMLFSCIYKHIFAFIIPDLYVAHLWRRMKSKLWSNALYKWGSWLSVLLIERLPVNISNIEEFLREMLRGQCLKQQNQKKKIIVALYKGNKTWTNF